MCGEHCWRCATSLALVSVENLDRPGDRITDSNARWLGLRPELEILRTIVLALPVSVMDPLMRFEEPPEQSLHDEDVLQDVRI